MVLGVDNQLYIGKYTSLTRLQARSGAPNAWRGIAKAIAMVRLPLEVRFIMGKTLASGRIVGL